jgi:hypothetical protein
MNGTGILKVYLVQSKKYSYRLHFIHAVAPECVLESLKELNSAVKIGFEEDSLYNEEDVSNVSAEEENKQAEIHESNPDEDDEEVQFIGGHEQQQVVLQSIKEAEDA